LTSIPPWGDGARAGKPKYNLAEESVVSRTIVVKGRVIGPRTVELEEPLPERTREVRVVADIGDGTAGLLTDYLRGLPPGNRSQADIDQQLREERDAWS
jgi:hypothetical protein